MGAFYRGKHIAGHWADSLYDDLMFRIPYSLGPLDDDRSMLDSLAKHYTQKPYLVPTWSRLTRNAHRMLPLDDLCRSDITVLDVHKQLVSGDPYGAIQNASLTLEGFVLELNSLTSFESPTKTWLGSVGNHVGGVQVDIELVGGKWTCFTVLCVLSMRKNQSVKALALGF